MTLQNPRENPARYPPDRRFHLWIRPKWFLLALALAALPLVAAWVQFWAWGLPAVASAAAAASLEPQGFPAWLRITHYVNFMFIVLLVRSGLQILADHPRLYWSVHCTPGTEWARFTPRQLTTAYAGTAKDDARYLSPWIGLPGYRHTIGMARHWHFLSALAWMLNGMIFVGLLFGTGQWQRLVPRSWQIVPDAWAWFVHYATFHLPAEPDTFVRYNALQQLSYFGVVFVLAPLAMLTGPSMSPALTNRFTWYPRLPGNRQIGRSLHFLVMCAFVAFVVVHVAMVAVTGLAENMNHIVLGQHDASRAGLLLGAVGIAAIVALNVLAHWLAWNRPRMVQHLARAIVTPVMRYLLDHPHPVAEFAQEDVSPFFWTNGKIPTSAEWQALAAAGFQDYRLQVGGLVENPLELSLADMRALPRQSQTTLHHCIQGWSGIAQWGGLSLLELIMLVRPQPGARAVVFFSFGEGAEGGQFYDSLSLENARHPQTLLAYEMNFQPLTPQHGAPLRLRAENQLGFKMVKSIQRIEFVASVASIYRGEGGYSEDNEYFGELANI